jgi:phenylpropionate dioxygenase-like ring-hydroxylating dioxygenase large terminal subunit
MGELFRRYWIPTLLAEELPAPDCPPVRVRILGEDLVAFRDSDGNVGLLDAHCPHRLADLFFGRNEECGLRCVYHGWKFDINGECVDMPNEPAESNFKSKIRTTAYPCREAGGVIWSYMGPPDKPADFPQLEWTRVPETHRFVGKVLVEANYLQTMEGELDNSHVAFLHSTLDQRSLAPGARSGLGSSRNAQSNYLAKDKSPRGVVKDTEYGIRLAWRRNADNDHYHWHVNQWLVPFYTMIATLPGETIMTIFRPPRDDESTWAFIVHWNGDRPLTEEEKYRFSTGGTHYVQLQPGTFLPKANMANDFLIDRSLQRSYSFTGIPTPIYNQDFAVTQGMGKIVDRTKEHLGTSDTVLIAVRRKLRKLAKDLQKGIEPYQAQHGEVYRIRAVDYLLPRDVSLDDAIGDLMVSKV